MTQGLAGFLHPGDRASLTCETDSANPPPHIDWTCDGRLLSHSSHVTIATSTLSGQYNASYTVSTLQFTVLDTRVAPVGYEGQRYQCSIQGQEELSQTDTLYLKSM